MGKQHVPGPLRRKAKKKSAGAAILAPCLVLLIVITGGAVGVENQKPNNAEKGGVYVQAENESIGTGTAAEANVAVNDDNIWYNHAKEGGGIYLYKDPDLYQGKIAQNIAVENGGGMYISDCRVTLSPTKDVTITGNQAVNGAGIYIHDSSSSSGSSSSSETLALLTPSAPLRQPNKLVCL